MKKILIGGLLVAASCYSFADYTSPVNGDIPESILEEELRVKIDCLADPNTAQGDCDLPTTTEPFKGSVSMASSANGSVMETPVGFNTTDLTRVTFGYSGAEGSGIEHANFELKQSCDYLKSTVEHSGYYGQPPNDIPVGDNAEIALGDYVSYTCVANPYLDIAETSVPGKKHITTGIEEFHLINSESCWSEGDIFFGLRGVQCDNGDVFVIATHNGNKVAGWGTEDYISCPSHSDSGRFDCNYNSTEEHTYKYIRHYDVVATPTSSSDEYQVDYNVDISYTFEKYRVYSLEDSIGIAPVDVAGITIFVPFYPESPNLGSSRVQYQGVSMTVGKRNLTEFWLGCEGRKETRAMEGDVDSFELRTFDLSSFAACDSGFSAGFKDLTTVDELFWYVDFVWGASEQNVWNKYANFLLEEVSDVFISQGYIDNLNSAASQSVEDTQAVIETLSNYIKGNNSLTGLQGFLTIEGDAYAVSDPIAEIDRVLIDSVDYGNGVLNLFEDGDLKFIEGDINAGAVPAYWRAYLTSTFASNIKILDKLHLLDMAKDIIDTSGEDESLLESMQVVADDAQAKLTQTIDKVVYFFDAIQARKDKAETFMVNLEAKFTELNSEASNADPRYSTDPNY
ncbi:MAG: hypothetical protein RPS47_12035 [Colwellia sp.]